MDIYYEDLDFRSLPIRYRFEVLDQYTAYPAKNSKRRFVMQSHTRGRSQHLDWRMEYNGFLVGWSIVGGNVEDPITPNKLLKEKARGFRAETKARQPKVWLQVHGDIKPGEVGAGVEAPGKLEIFTIGEWYPGAQKVYFHEYFLKDSKYFKDWTRIIVRAIRVPRIDPDTKVPRKGQFENLWRVMIPSNQEPYTISNRSIKEGWKPPKGQNTFPEEWVKKNYNEQYTKWKEYNESKLSDKKIKYTLSMHSYRGPIHVRGMFIRDWYLMLDTGNGRIRIFRLDDNPLLSTSILAYDEGSDNRKYLDLEGETKPNSRFNPNKSIRGEMKIIKKGTLGIESDFSGDKEKLIMDIPGLGKWEMIQEEKKNNTFTFQKIEEDTLSKAIFVYEEHEVPKGSGKIHWDLRIGATEESRDMFEFNLYNNLLESESSKAYIKKILDPKWLEVKKNEDWKIGNLDTKVNTLDSGFINIINLSEDFISMLLEGNTIKGYYVYKNGILSKSKLPKALSTDGDPNTGPYDPFIIREKKGWDYFYLDMYDIRKFTRCEPIKRTKDYLKLEIPKSLEIHICIYPVLGKISNVRVVNIKADKKEWDSNNLKSWVKKNNLDTWKREMIRE